MKKVYTILAILLTFVLIVAFQVEELPEGVDKVIAGIIAFAVVLLGPKPLKAIFDALKFPGGAWRVFGTYAVAMVVGIAALAAAGAITETPTTAEQVLALAGMLSTAVTAAFHRLKGLGEI